MIELFYSQFDSTKLKPKNNVPVSMKTSLPVRLQFSKTSFFTSAKSLYFAEECEQTYLF